MSEWIFLHGFGVRGGFWDLVVAHLPPGQGFSAPDFDHADVESAIHSVRAFLQKRAEHGPVHVVGHSLGGIFGALAAASLDSQQIASLTILSSPWESPVPQKEIPLVFRFLMSKGLLPGFLIRSRFFGAGVPVKAQKALFQSAVPESAPLRELIGKRPWFHKALVPAPYPHPLQVIGSEGDRIVSAAESRAMAKDLGARLVILPKERKWGHDDPAVSPQAAQELVKFVADFVSRMS